MMVDIAERILDKCVVACPDKNRGDEGYSVIFNYEFIEDIGEG